MNLNSRLTALERRQSEALELRRGVVCYDGQCAPKDPGELAAYLDTLRPDDTSAVVYVALGDNGRGFSPPTPVNRTIG